MIIIAAFIWIIYLIIDEFNSVRKKNKDDFKLLFKTLKDSKNLGELELEYLKVKERANELKKINTSYIYSKVLSNELKEVYKNTKQKLLINQ